MATNLEKPRAPAKAAAQTVPMPPVAIGQSKV